MADERPVGLSVLHSRKRETHEALSFATGRQDGSCRQRRDRYLSPPNGFIVVLSLSSAGDRYPRRVAFRPVVAELGSGAIKNGGSFDGQLAGCMGRGCPQPRQCRAASALGPWHIARNPSNRRFSEKRNQ